MEFGDETLSNSVPKDVNRIQDCAAFVSTLAVVVAESWDTAEAGVRLELGDHSELAQHAAQCGRCSARLSAAQILLKEKRIPMQSPPGLEAKVRAHVQSAGRRDITTADSFSLHRYRQRPAKRIFAIAAAAALLVVATAVITTAVVRSQTSDTVLVNLMLEAPQAMRVAVVGDWNEWNSDAQILADPDGDGVWTIRFRVARGQEYQYQFVIDDELWLGDPNAVLQLDDGFGGTNSVLEI